MESSMRVLKIKIELLYDPVIPLLGIYLKECKSGYNKDTCASMFIAAQFTIVRLWKKPRCPTTDEGIKKIYIYTMENSDIKKNEIITFAGKWVELENIMLSKVS
jgi:hypothetical protein